MPTTDNSNVVEEVRLRGTLIIQYDIVYSVAPSVGTVMLPHILSPLDPL